jgi:hypothetical protein
MNWRFLFFYIFIYLFVFSFLKILQNLGISFSNRSLESFNAHVNGNADKDDGNIDAGLPSPLLSSIPTSKGLSYKVLGLKY